MAERKLIHAVLFVYQGTVRIMKTFQDPEREGWDFETIIREVPEEISDEMCRMYGSTAYKAQESALSMLGEIAANVLAEQGFGVVVHSDDFQFNSKFYIRAGHRRIELALNLDYVDPEKCR